MSDVFQHRSIHEADHIEALQQQIRELTRQRDDARDLAVRSGIFESDHDPKVADRNTENPLEAIEEMMAFNSRDWAQAKSDAWLVEAEIQRAMRSNQRPMRHPHLAGADTTRRRDRRLSMGWLKEARQNGETFGKGGFMFGRGGFWELVKREAWVLNGQRSTTDWDVMRLKFVNTEAFWGTSDVPTAAPEDDTQEDTTRRRDRRLT